MISVFVCSLFDVAVKFLLFSAELVGEWNVMWNVAFVAKIKGVSRIFLKGLRNTKKQYEKQDFFAPAEI
jgi:hypothetical protein